MCVCVHMYTFVRSGGVTDSDGGQPPIRSSYSQTGGCCGGKQYVAAVIITRVGRVLKLALSPHPQNSDVYEQTGTPVY